MTFHAMKPKTMKKLFSSLVKEFTEPRQQRFMRAHVKGTLTVTNGKWVVRMATMGAFSDIEPEELPSGGCFLSLDDIISAADHAAVDKLSGVPVPAFMSKAAMEAAGEWPSEIDELAPQPKEGDRLMKLPVASLGTMLELAKATAAEGIDLSWDEHGRGVATATMRPGGEQFVFMVKLGAVEPEDSDDL